MYLFNINIVCIYDDIKTTMHQFTTLIFRMIYKQISKTCVHNEYFLNTQNKCRNINVSGTISILLQTQSQSLVQHTADTQKSL